MFFTSAPEDIRNHILTFIDIPENITSDNIKLNGRSVSNLLCTNKEINQKMKDICSKKLADLKKIYDVIGKYSKYNDILENKRYTTGKRLEPQGNPQLLDALSTGLYDPHSQWGTLSSFNEYTQEIENDIKDIVRLTPQSLKCNIGLLPSEWARYYDRLPP